MSSSNHGKNPSFLLFEKAVDTVGEWIDGITDIAAYVPVAMPLGLTTTPERPRKV
jgi:hypothetical protein